MDKRINRRLVLIAMSWILLAVGIMAFNHFCCEIRFVRAIGMQLIILGIPHHVMILRVKKQIEVSDKEYILVWIFAFVMAAVVSAPFFFIS